MSAGEPTAALPHDAAMLQRARDAVAEIPTGLLIDGGWRPAERPAIAVDDPATGQRIAEVAAAGAAEVDLAVAAAARAMREGPWPRMGGTERGRLIARLADLVERDAERMALIESLDTGGPVGVLRAFDVPMAIAAARENASWANKITGEVPMVEAGAGAFAFATREPVGVAAIITPWNAPLLMALKKTAAALAAGCTVVLKPAELAPLSALWLGRLVEEVGFPPGTVNIVVGEGAVAGQALIDHPGVRMVSFTGSTAVGRGIVAASARSNLKRFVLELGGKSPVLVFADADLDKAAASVAREIVFKSGQYCGAGTRLFVEAPVFEDFVRAVAGQLAGFRIGAGLGAGAEFGALISDRQRARVVRLVEEAVAAGAEPALAGGALFGPGYFHGPVVLTGAGRGMGVFDMEVFGPVLCARPFDPATPLQALAAEANDTDYGLSAKIWTRDASRILRLARLVEAGNVLVNGGGGEKALPFGGFKLSGFGRENGREGINAFTEIKTVRIGL